MSPPSSIVNAANPDHKHRRPAGETSKPVPGSRGRHVHTSSRGPHTRHAFGHRLEHHADRLDNIEPADEQERRDQRMRHATRRAASPGQPQPPTTTTDPDRPLIPGPPTHRLSARRTLGPRHYRRPASSHIRVDRNRTRPYDGHGCTDMLPDRSPPSANSTTREGSLAFTRTPNPHRPTHASPKSTAEINPRVLTQSGRQHVESRGCETIPARRV